VGAIRDGWQGTPRIERWDGRGRWGTKEEESDGGRGGGRRDPGHDLIEGEVGDRDAIQVHEGVVSGEVHGRAKGVNLLDATLVAVGTVGKTNHPYPLEEEPSTPCSKNDLQHHLKKQRN